MANYYKEINNMIEKTIYKLMIADRRGLDLGKKGDELNFLDTIVIKKIGDDHSVPQFNILKEIEVSRSLMTAIIKKLVSYGYIVKEKSKEDKRVNILSLTEEGKRIRSQIIAAEKCTLDYVLHDITLNEEKAILKFLAKASQRIVVEKI